jgi:hypothetical protein
MYISPKANAIIKELLARHGISVYEIEAIPEGKELPGSTYPGELKSMSGYVTTPTRVYEFWFNWKDDHYTLGEEDGSWQEVEDETEREAKITREIQQRLGRKLVASHQYLMPQHGTMNGEIGGAISGE